MMNKLIKAGIIPFILLMALMVLVSLNVAAAGLGVAPANLEITDVLKGEEYQKAIQAMYSGEGECVLQLSASGDISDIFGYRHHGDTDDYYCTAGDEAIVKKEEITEQFGIKLILSSTEI